MDDEDLGEFGFAPQRVQTTEDFTPQDANSKAAVNRKRKIQQSSGPIPGAPVLHNLLQPAKENVAIRLLKKMGWKFGQGIGARQTRKEKKAASERNARELYIMKKYGCDLGPLQSERPPGDDGADSEGSDLSNEEITFAPDDFEPYICGIKDNTFGLGYTGLSRKPVLKEQHHVDLFDFEGVKADGKKLPIRGQAFGVGALEEEDEDIYERDDMTKYDFSLEEAKKAKPKKQLREDVMVVEGFNAARNEGQTRKKKFVVPISADFRPRNWAVRRSRFEPLNENKAALLKRQDEHKTRGLGRHDLNPDERGSILGEGTKRKMSEEDMEKRPEKKIKKSYLERINEKYKIQEAKLSAVNIMDDKLEQFAKGEILNAENTETIELDENTKKENEKVQEEAKNITKSLDTSLGVFKPFINNQAKQERYEKFLEANLRWEDEIMKFLATIQPLSLSDWDREMEMKEFLQARKIYKPLKGSMSDRFVSEATAVAEREIIDKLPEDKKKVEINRKKIAWRPNPLLCKRFNITTACGSAIPEEIGVRRSRFSVFDYIEPSINTKHNFVTPIIRPTKAEKPKLIIQQPTERERRSGASRFSTNEQVRRDPETSRFPRKDLIIEKEKERDSGTSRLSTKELFEKEISTPKDDAPTPSTSKEVITESKSDGDSEKNTILIANPSLVISPAKDQLKKPVKPKSDLEKKVEESINKHPSEKKDLFKAIFDSSSEDEDEGDKGKAEQNTENPGNASTSQEIIHTLTKPADEVNALRSTALTKPADEVNVLRSTAPPKGIFAHVFKSNKPLVTPAMEVKISSSDTKEELVAKPTKDVLPENSSSNDSSSVSDDQQERDIYGPKIPKKPVQVVSSDDQGTADVLNSSIALSDDMHRKLIKFLKKSKKTEVIEEWVEKSEVGSKERKKKKKEKDKKKKSKKHKKEKKKHKDKK